MLSTSGVFRCLLVISLQTESYSPVFVSDVKIPPNCCPRRWSASVRPLLQYVYVMCSQNSKSVSQSLCVSVCVSWDRKAIVTFVQVCRCDITTPLLKNRFPRDHRYGINCALQCAVLVLTRKEENQGRKQKYLSSDWQKVNRMFLLHSRRHHAEQEDMM